MRQPDMEKLNSLVERLVGDVGAAMSGALVALGDHLGLFQAMKGGIPVTSDELARKTGIRERYLREWLSALAASDYVTYDAETERFSLTPEQAMVFAEEDSPAFIAGAFESVQSLWMDEPKIAEAFRNGTGLGWHEHSACLFRGTERFFRTGYNANLVDNWIPALGGVREKLETGAKVADVGCGHGASTIVMARAYPRSHFFGFDYHAPRSTGRGRQRARPGSATASPSSRQRRKHFPPAPTIWSPCSIACTTWAIRSVPAAMSRTRWRPAAPG